MRKCRRDSRKPRGVGPRQITSGPHYGVVAKSGLKCWFLIWSTMRPPPPASTGLAECLVFALCQSPLLALNRSRERRLGHGQGGDLNGGWPCASLTCSSNLSAHGMPAG